MIKIIIKKILIFFGYETIVLKKKKFSNIDKILINKITKNPIIFDIGAYNGISIDRFVNLFLNPQIHSFEPNKKIFNQLTLKYSKMKNVKLNNLAVSDKNASKKFFIYTRNEDLSSFSRIQKKTIFFKKFFFKRKNFFKLINTQSITLDKYCQNKKIKKINLLKIDVQANEDLVLKGSSRMLSKGKIDIIQCELILDSNYNKYLSFYDIEKYLVPNGYRLVASYPGNQNLFEGDTYCIELVYFKKSLIK
jgi:FkbM family methyltransferase